MVICPHCNKPIEQGQPWVQCPACGAYAHHACWEQHHGCVTPGCPYVPQPVQTPQPAIPKSPVPIRAKKASDAKKKKTGLLIVAAVAALALIGGLIFIFTSNQTKAPASPQIRDVLAVGMYREALELAPNDQKKDVLWENLTAYLARDVLGYLSNPSSFTLQAAWLNEGEKQAVLQGMGDGVSQYWLFSYDSAGRTYPMTGNIKNIQNDPQHAAWPLIQAVTARSEWKLGDDHIDNINQLYRSGALYSLYLMEQWMN